MALEREQLQKVSLALTFSIKRVRARLLQERALLLSIRKAVGGPAELPLVRLRAEAILRGKST